MDSWGPAVKVGGKMLPRIAAWQFFVRCANDHRYSVTRRAKIGKVGVARCPTCREPAAFVTGVVAWESEVRA